MLWDETSWVTFDCEQSKQHLCNKSCIYICTECLKTQWTSAAFNLFFMCFCEENMVLQLKHTDEVKMTQIHIKDVTLDRGDDQIRGRKVILPCTRITNTTNIFIFLSQLQQAQSLFTELHFRNTWRTSVHSQSSLCCCWPSTDSRTELDFHFHFELFPVNHMLDAASCDAHSCGSLCFCPRLLS